MGEDFIAGFDCLKHITRTHGTCLHSWLLCSVWRRGASEQPPHGTPWVLGLVGHFVQTWPDIECSHTAELFDCSLTLQSLLYFYGAELNPTPVYCSHPRSPGLDIANLYGSSVGLR